MRVQQSRRYLIGIIMLFTFVVSSALAAAKPIINIQHWKTKTGVNVYFVSAPEIPMLDVNVIFRAGSAYDGKNYGIASFANSMIDEGTRHYDANQIATAFDNVGAVFGASTDRDMAIVSLRSLVDPKYLQPALHMFSLILSQASFPAKAFTRLQNRTLAAIKISQQSPTSVAADAFYHALYQQQPYGHPTIGTMDTVKQLTREQVASFYQKYYVASNAKIVMVGDITLSKAKTVANQIVANLKQGSPAPALKQKVIESKDIVKHIKFPAKQTTIYLGQIGITRENPYYFPLLVGNHVFGGMPLSSMLFQQVRNKRGLAYYAVSYFNPLLMKGPFIITLQTKAAQTKEAINVVRQTLAEFLAKGPAEKQIKQAKSNLIDSFPLKIDTNKEILANVTSIAFYNRPLNYLDLYRKKVSAVTAKEIKKAFDHLIKTNQLVTITVGPQQ
jgi:zinc protease